MVLWVFTPKWTDLHLIHTMLSYMLLLSRLVPSSWACMPMGMTRCLNVGLSPKQFQPSYWPRVVWFSTERRGTYMLLEPPLPTGLIVERCSGSWVCGYTVDNPVIPLLTSLWRFSIYKKNPVWLHALYQEIPLQMVLTDTNLPLGTRILVYCCCKMNWPAASWVALCN